MIKVERGTAHVSYEYYTVLVEPGDLVTAAGKTLPYSTWIGTFTRDGKINVWIPAASVPRGYKAAATQLLRTTADTFLANLVAR
jgi:hypothetical protein